MPICLISHYISCHMLESDEKPAAITTTTSNEKKLPPTRKNISGPPTHNVGTVVAQTPDFDTLPDYEEIALSRPGHLVSLWSSPISVESSTSKPLTITSFKGGVNRISISPKTAEMQSNGSSPSISIGENGFDIPQLPENCLNTLDNPPKCLAFCNGEKDSNSFLFMDFIVRSWWRYLIEKGHLPDDVIESKKSLQEKFDAIFGQKLFNRFPKDKKGRINSFPADMIKEISHSGDRQLRPDEYNIPKLLAFFRAQDSLAGDNSQIKKLREEVASQLQYPFGTRGIPDEFEMTSSSGRYRLMKKKKRKAGPDGTRTFYQTIGHTVGRVAFPVQYLYSNYEKWGSGKLIFASVGDSGTVGDGFHMFEPIGIDKLKGSKPSDLATARKSLVGIHDRRLCQHNWPLKLFHLHV